MPSRQPSLSRSSSGEALPQSPGKKGGMFGKLRKLRKDEEGDMWGCVGMEGEEQAATKAGTKKALKKRPSAGGGFGSWLEEEMGEFGLLDHGGRRGPATGKNSTGTKSNPDLTRSSSSASSLVYGTMPRTPSSTHSHLSTGSSSHLAADEARAAHHRFAEQRASGASDVVGLYLDRDSRRLSKKPSLDSLATSFRSSGAFHSGPHSHSSGSSAVSFSMTSSGHSSAHSSGLSSQLSTSPTSPPSNLPPPVRGRSGSIREQLPPQLAPCPEDPAHEPSSPPPPHRPPRSRARSASGAGLAPPVAAHFPPPVPPIPGRWGPSPLPPPAMALPPIPPPPAAAVPIMPPAAAGAAAGDAGPRVVYHRVQSGFPEDVSAPTSPDEYSPSEGPTGGRPSPTGTRKPRRQYDFF